MHMAQLMPLSLTVSCLSRIQIGFTFLVPAHLGSPGQRAVKRVCVSFETFGVNKLFAVASTECYVMFTTLLLLLILILDMEDK